MPRLTNQNPKYRKHKPSGQAIVSIDGMMFYLGPHGTKAEAFEALANLVAAKAVRSAGAAMPSQKHADEPPPPAVLYMAPVEMIALLPLDGMTDRQKRHQLDRIRKRIAAWADIDQHGQVRSDHWTMVVKLLKVRSLNKRDVSGAVELLPCDPSPTDLEALRAEIKQQNLAAMRAPTG